MFPYAKQLSEGVPQGDTAPHISFRNPLEFDVTVHSPPSQYCSDKPKNLKKLGSVGGLGSMGRSNRKNSPLFPPFLVFSISFSTDNFFNRTVLPPF